MELDYRHPIDMWSLGCILVELHTGEPLFAGRHEADQLEKIVEVKGMPPVQMIESSPKAKKFFTLNGLDEFGQKKYELRSKSVVKKRDLSQIIGVNTHGPNGRRLGEPGHTVIEYLKFYDLVEKMLEYDPTKRINPIQALQHPFFAPILQDKSSEESSSSSTSQTSNSSGSAVAAPSAPNTTRTDVMKD